MGKKKLLGPVTLHIAGVLAARKAELGWSYDKIAETSGVTKPTVVYALKGEQSIAVESYVALCASLGIDAGQLLDEAAALMPTEADALTLAADHSTTPTDRDRLEAQDHDDPA